MNMTNKGIIRKLTVRFLGAGRTRNIIVVNAIALTAVMFTSVFTIGGNMISAIQEQTMRQVGTRSHGGFKFLTQEQYEHIARSPLIKDISYNMVLAFAENKELKKVQNEIRYAEDKNARWNFSYPSVGKMPQTASEVACSTITLDTLGIPHQLGAYVPLEFTVGDMNYSETFTLSGYWTGDPVLGAQQIWLSRIYVDAVLLENAAVLAAGSVAQGDYAGTISADVWFENAVDIEVSLLRLISERGYLADDIYYGVNWAYMGSGIEFDPLAVIIAALVLALILASGYLIIYSIFIISVNNDIHFYGLLKTIGTTGKQLRRIVRLQALILSAIGIPVGLALGYAGGVLLSPFMLNIISVGDSFSTSANPLIFAFAAAFSLLTVFIGCRKPGRIAARVSPVDAVKYNGVQMSEKRKAKKTRNVTPLAMALANVTREKGKLCVIVVSLSLSLILLNSAFSAVRSFDMDAYLSNSIISDFAVADYSIFTATGSRVKNTNGVTADFLREAQARGVGKISNIYYHSKTDSMASQVYGVGEQELENCSDVAYERLRSSNYVIVSKYVITFGDNVVVVPEIGDVLTLTNDSGKACDFEVIGLVDEYPFSLSARFRYGNSLDIIVAADVFLDFFGAVQPMQTNINVSAENLPAFETWLDSYTGNQNPDMSFISRNTLKAEFDGLQMTYITLGGAMSFVLALIGVLNFINAVVASIAARRRELAMLQSVGMTGRQMRNTLFYEGVCYTALTVVFTLTAGLGLGYLIVQVIAGQIWFFSQRFTIMPSLYCVAPLFLICAIVPTACYKWMIRDSLVERLRVE